MNAIDAIRQRLEACPIPIDARADWNGTNHYEITTSARRAEDAGEYWWLDNLDWMFAKNCDWSATETGKRLGACLDYAVAYKRDVSALLAEMAFMETNMRQSNTEPLHVARWLAPILIILRLARRWRGGSVWYRKLDERWEFWVNLNMEPAPVDGADTAIQAGDVYVKFNGWPAGIFSIITGEGCFAAGEAASPDAFCDALRAAIAGASA